MREKHALFKDIKKTEEHFPIEISRMTEASVESVKQIEIECNLSTWTDEDYKSEILRKDSITIIAKNKDIIMGFLVARLIMQEDNIVLFNSNKKNTAKDNNLNEAEIYNIAVRKEFQNRGIGQLLLDNFLKSAGAYNILKIWLEVRESNQTAIRFYRRNRFEEVSLRKNFYSAPTENGVVMRLSLSSEE